jgi:hypothetical protein
MTEKSIDARLAVVEDRVGQMFPMVQDLHRDFISRQERGRLLKLGAALAKSSPAALTGAVAALAAVWTWLPKVPH